MATPCECGCNCGFCRRVHCFCECHIVKAAFQKVQLHKLALKYKIVKKAEGSLKIAELLCRVRDHKKCKKIVKKAEKRNATELKRKAT